jgi:DNA-binding transcriptional MocR family regulator
VQFGGTMPQPIYQQIANDLRKQIESGPLKPGQQLPTEITRSSPCSPRTSRPDTAAPRARPTCRRWARHTGSRTSARSRWEWRQPRTRSRHGCGSRQALRWVSGTRSGTSTAPRGRSRPPTSRWSGSPAARPPACSWLRTSPMEPSSTWKACPASGRRATGTGSRRGHPMTRAEVPGHRERREPARTAARD